MDGVSELRYVITQTGAREHVEELIEKLTSTALDALNRDEIGESARALLTELANTAIQRSL
jgi:geranylgeranyl diphosphate synthase type I